MIVYKYKEPSHRYCYISHDLSSLKVFTAYVKAQPDWKPCRNRCLVERRMMMPPCTSASVCWGAWETLPVLIIITSAVLHNIKNLRGWEQFYLTDSQGGGPWTAYMILDKWDVKPFGDNGGGDVAFQADSPNSPVWRGEDWGRGCGGQPCVDKRGEKTEDPLD